jgi:hypothetical protein
VALRFQAQVALAGVRQLRMATRRLAQEAARLSAIPGSTRMLDDWDDGETSAPSLELAYDPTQRR